MRSCWTGLFRHFYDLTQTEGSPSVQKRGIYPSKRKDSAAGGFSGGVFLGPSFPPAVDPGGPRGSSSAFADTKPNQTPFGSSCRGIYGLFLAPPFDSPKGGSTADFFPLFFGPPARQRNTFSGLCAILQNVCRKVAFCKMFAAKLT